MIVLWCIILLILLVNVCLGIDDIIVSSEQVKVPVIDISSFLNGDKESRLNVAKQIGKACVDVGFFVIIGHGVDDIIIQKAWNATRDFFDLPEDEKKEYITKSEAEYPFGYSQFGGEVLSAGKAADPSANNDVNGYNSKAPDLKEMFSLGPGNPLAGFPSRRWPIKPDDFETSWTLYYDTMANLAAQLLKACAIALELSDENYFDQFIDHHASALRALNYPHLENYIPLPGQLRASAHTDYGSLTILRSDSPGLQVSKDKYPPNWHDVPFVENGFIVNLGDLMKRWTNDVWLSTLHRVVNPPLPEGGEECTSSTRRQSMAFFHNLNRDAIVRVLNSDNPKYEPIIAGDFLMQKHLAAQGL